MMAADRSKAASGVPPALAASEVSLVVRGAPQEFVCRQGCWSELETRLAARNIGRTLIVSGRASWRAASPHFPKLRAVKAVFETYGGESTYAERDRLARIIEAGRLQAVIAVGGGKVTDVSKAAANKAGVPVVVLPTLAATCAAWTPLSIMYDEAGTMAGFDVFPRSNSLVLLDPHVLLDSPAELLAAGIGDTLAKWYEADVVLSQADRLPVEMEIARFAARTCRDNLLAYGEAALEALGEKRANEAFVTIVETIVMAAGMVGGFGDRCLRTAGAHSVHDGLTVLPEAHGTQHGMKVAYGILVQLVLESKWPEIDALLPFYRRIGLPASLKEMNLHALTAEQKRAVAERSVEAGASIHLLPGEVTAEKVLAAMERLESYVAAADR